MTATFCTDEHVPSVFITTLRPSGYLNTPKDFEDAVHFYSLFEETLSIHQLKQWVNKLGVEDEYERLKQA